MPFILLLLLILAAQAAPVDASALADLPAGLGVGFVVGLGTGWGLLYSLGWNGRVEAQRVSDVDRAEDTARKARRPIPLLGAALSMVALVIIVYGLAYVAGQ